MKKCESIFRTNENQYINYLIYPYNSLSSISYFISGIYLLDNNLLYALNLILLGIFSILWWAYQNEYYHYYDKLLYSLNFFLIGYMNDNIISIRFLFYNIFTYYYFNIIFIFLRNKNYFDSGFFSTM
jgi:hypothetical protein